MSSQNNDLKNRVEAILFSIGKPTELATLSLLVQEKQESKVKKALEELHKEYEARTGALMVVQDSSKWKITVRESYLDLVRKIVADTELSKSVMETLAVIAWHNPAIQSEVIKIRTNKAYDDIRELQELGFITREKHGRSMKIGLTEKFFNYFELTGDKDIRDVFAKIKKKIGQTDPALDVYDEKREEFTEEPEHLGKLEVFDEPDKTQSENEKESGEDTEKQVSDPGASEEALPELDIAAVTDDDSKEEEAPGETEEVKESTSDQPNLERATTTADEEAEKEKKKEES